MKAAKAVSGLPLLAAGLMASSVITNEAGPAMVLCGALAAGHIAFMAATPDKGWGWFPISACFTFGAVAALAGVIGFPWWAAGVAGLFFAFLSWLAALAGSIAVELTQ